MSNVKYEWDGDKVKQTTKVEDIKLTPKDVIEYLDDVRSRIDSMKDQKVKMQEQLTTQNTLIASARAYEHERIHLETKCVELNTATLKKLIEKLTPELIPKAEMEAQKIIDRAPDAYTDQMKINQKYVIFQKMLATDKKVAEKISKRLITNLLFDTPIFENPFN